jgi:hypothetical protein
MANTWFVMIPPAYGSKSDDEKRLVDFRVSYPADSQAWKDANAGHVIHGSEGNQGNPQIGEDLVKWKGPFATEAEAKAAQNPKQQSPNPVNDAVNAVQNSNNGLGAFLQYPEKALAWISNRGNIVRIVKVVAGGGMVLVGLTMLVNKETNIGTAVKSVATKGIV